MIRRIAHRGLKYDGVKENSYTSIFSAIKSDYFVGFECDIRTTKDHVFVLSHNPFIKNYLVSHTNYSLLKRKFDIVSLEHIMHISTDKIMLLEIKEMNFDSELFLKLMWKYCNKNIYVMSFHNDVIKSLKTVSCPFKIGILNYVLNSEDDYDDYDFICLLESVVTDNLMKYFNRKNIEVFIYGIHHLEEDMEKYPDAYFITDEIV